MSALDRFGDEVDEPPPEIEQVPLPAEEPCSCDHGWLDYLDAEHPVPCPRCKPHLAGPRVHLH